MLLVLKLSSDEILTKIREYLCRSATRDLERTTEAHRAGVKELAELMINRQCRSLIPRYTHDSQKHLCVVMATDLEGTKRF